MNSFLPNVFFFSVSVLQVFTNELRSVAAILEANIQLGQLLQEGLRECHDVMGEAVKEIVLSVSAQNLTEDGEVPEVAPEEVWRAEWPLYALMALSLSMVGLMALIAIRLGVPRTEVSKFFESFYA